MKGSCQRQTQGFDLPGRSMIALVTRPAAENRMISARHTCFCGALRFLTIARRRLRSEGFTLIDIPLRMRQTRMRKNPRESLSGIKCQILSTISAVALVVKNDAAP